MHPKIRLQGFPFSVESIFHLDALFPFLHPSSNTPGGNLGSRWEPSCWCHLCPEEEGAVPLNQKSHCLQTGNATGSRAADAGKQMAGSCSWQDSPGCSGNRSPEEISAGCSETRMAAHTDGTTLGAREAAREAFCCWAVAVRLKATVIH